MTTPTDQFTGIAQRSVDTTATAIRSWTESLQGYAGFISAENPMPRPAELHIAVNTWFNLAAALLTEQRAFVSTLIDASVEASGTFTEQARTVAAAVPFRPVDVTSHGATA